MEQSVLERHLNVTGSRLPLSDNPVVLVVVPSYADFALLSETETEAELESDIDPGAHRRSQFADLDRLAGMRLRVTDPHGRLPKDQTAD